MDRINSAFVDTFDEIWSSVELHRGNVRLYLCTSMCIPISYKSIQEPHVHSKGPKIYFWFCSICQQIHSHFHG